MVLCRLLTKTRIFDAHKNGQKRLRRSHGAAVAIKERPSRGAFFVRRDAFCINALSMVRNSIKIKKNRKIIPIRLRIWDFFTIFAARFK